jgi:uncharacterized membrane protein HdeD (DUF308 family)
VSILAAFAVGALGNLVGAALNGVDPSWDMGFLDMVLIMLAQVLGLLVGFMLGVLFRNSAGALVAYFVYAFVLPGVFGILAATQKWFREVQPWIDFNFAQNKLFDAPVSAQEWANLATAGAIWLLIPLAIGLRIVLRSEVK